MPISSNSQLCAALNHDLNKSGLKPAINVVDDVPRKTFTANKDGAVIEFAHKQPDSNFWNGVKYYSSGKRCNVRFLRTKSEPAIPASQK